MYGDLSSRWYCELFSLFDGNRNFMVRVVLSAACNTKFLQALFLRLLHTLLRAVGDDLERVGVGLHPAQSVDVLDIARQDHLGRVANLWPLLFLALPIAWGARAALQGGFVALLWLLLTAWVLFALSFLRRRRPGDVPRAVGHLLAGICLWDALVIADAGQPALAAGALALFALTLMLQRFVAPT